MATTYLSCFDYALSTSGLEFNSLVSNMTRVGGTGVLAGATSVPILASGLQSVLNSYDRLTIFDGSTSETVSVTATTSIGATSVPCTALQFNHAVGIPICGDGIMGSLANAIYTASTYLENICQQSLFAASYANEALALPTMRASIDNGNALNFRPRHWPITAITSVTLNSLPNLSTTYDPTQVVLDSDKQICSIPNMQPISTGGGQSAYYLSERVSRSRKAQLVISYSAGFSTMPFDVTESAILLTSDILAKRLNPIGAPDVGSGSRHISAVLRGDGTGESLLYKRAQAMLNTYSVQSF